MSSPEHVFALFVESNPVMDPDQLVAGFEVATAGIHPVDDVELHVVDRLPTPHRGWRPTLVAAVVVLLVGATSYGAFLVSTTLGGPVAAGEASMRLVFDGQSCVYLGPTELLPGDGVITVERADGAEPVAFLALPIIDDLATFDDAVQWAAQHSAQVAPQFAGVTMDVVFADEELHQDVLTVTMRAGRYLLACNTSPEGTDRAHPAAILTVTPG